MRPDGHHNRRTNGRQQPATPEFDLERHARVAWDFLAWGTSRGAGDAYDIIGGAICRSFLVFGLLSVVMYKLQRRWMDKKRDLSRLALEDGELEAHSDSETTASSPELERERERERERAVPDADRLTLASSRLALRCRRRQKRGQPSTCC